MKSVESYRSEFPVTERYLYLDHAGIAPVSIRVVRAVREYLEQASRGGAFHYAEWSQRVRHVRTAAAQLVHSAPDEIAFIRSTSHGLSLVAEGLDWNVQDNVVVYEKEFPSNLFPWMHLKRKGVEVRLLPYRGGEIALEDIERTVDRKTRLLSISAVQFTNGFRMDLKRLGAFCKDKGILFCVDAIQGLGAIGLDVQECHVDFLAADAHKWLLGPEGIGIFYCRRGLAERLHPSLTGWKSVRNELSFEDPVFELKNDALRFEEGSLNLMGICGLGAALDMLLEIGMERVEKRVLDLGDHVMRRAGERGMNILTPQARDKRAGIVTITGAGDPVRMRDELRRNGIMVNVRLGGIRVSPHFYNTEEDIDRLFAAMDSESRQ